MVFKKYKLKDLGEIVTGKTPKKSNKEYYNSNDIMFIKPDDLFQDNILLLDKSKEYISKKGAETVRVLPKNSVLVTCIGTIGKVAILYSDKAAFNQQINAIIPNEKIIISKFLAYSIWFNRLKLHAIANAPIVPIINKTQFSEFEIQVPNIDYQKKVVNILDKASDLINKRKSQIEALDQLTQSVFLEMFGDPVTNPNGWEIVNLQDIADYFIGLTYKPNDVSDEGIIVLRSSNIQNGVIDLNDIVRVKKEVNDKLLVKQNDILMCSRNGSARLVGKVALIPELEERMTFGAFMTIIRSRYYCYLYNYFQSSAFRRQITSGATTTINQITKKMLNYVKLPLPPTSLQNEFAHKVEQIQHQKEILQTSLLELENMYNSLMQKAFKGELFTEEKVSNL